MKKTESIAFKAIKEHSKKLFWIMFASGLFSELSIRHLVKGDIVELKIIIFIAIVFFSVYVFLFKSLKSRYEMKYQDDASVDVAFITFQKFFELNKSRKLLFWMQNLGLLFAAFAYGWAVSWLIFLVLRSY